MLYEVITIFSGIRPDLKLMGVLARLAFKNTDSLIGGVADAPSSSPVMAHRIAVGPRSARVAAIRHSSTSGTCSYNFV